MDLITLLVVLIVVGGFLAILQLIPLDATVKRIIQIIAIVAVAIWLLRAFAPALSF